MAAAPIVSAFQIFAQTFRAPRADTWGDVQGMHETPLGPQGRGQSGVLAVEEIFMANCHLRIYYGPDGETELKSVADGSVPASNSYQQRVTVPLKDVLQTLAEAVYRNRGWIQDFADDEITISTDLFEVILAYQHYHRPSA